ncbi:MULTISPECIES: ribosomal protein S18-alanine N-acetyltransferase [Legionella]|uniref:[Ribosomal protein bS18]-alanine N-acetyltransferase n=1 Tax=Legionella septentrionalis TaxID=2498109 RepID=A0A3S0VNR2_9GAMM|nr:MULTISPECIES: ribosomal protein S18-alanine N-acetyltransferase [Legionella]MCP0914472.1 ribosomal protein S18-alanine N-acetyltransferase [Legionella sp. 27cVA30]RUQ89465.1 ribosomal-protein-alanine N-acetyltransferase [Legionella septentrionalis]RUQ97306.1 ribosomal-protein-alanine N-acetyltransferase [Legionella septentrionalis]RUR10478.1 ribosomal-protein-alanine N-acetyltransferase [Legionella septentrionalis]RUR16098.1 ribosomal-protein-alanine N-acetyltransferase [Legionella septentr
MRPHVRPMQTDDIDEVYAIELMAHRAPWSRNILSDCVLVGYDCRVLELLATERKEIVGYIIARYHGNVCHVLNLCITPAQQGKHYGRFLLGQLIKSLNEIEVSKVVLEVRPSNTAALSLYQKMGFEKVGTKTAYYCDEQGIEDAVVLEKICI